MTSTDSEQNSLPAHVCSNCFAEFEWEPFSHEGEDYCCSGCSVGGPCICTYSGAPHLAEDDAEVVGADGTSPGDQLATEEAPEEDVPVVAASGGTPPEPHEQAHTSQSPDEYDDEVPTNGRLAIIMAAISEMPFPVQQVVQARLSSSGDDDEIGQPLGLDGEEVRQLIRQGQAILDRTIGTTFRIRYIGPEEIAEDDATEPEFPPFEDGEPGTDAELVAPEGLTPADESTEADSEELSQLIARSFSSLAEASTADFSEDQSAREVLSETLREVGNLLRIASERLESDGQSEIPLREALADARGSDEPVKLIVENQPDITDFFMAVQEHESVQWAKLRSQTESRAEFSLVIGSMMGFVRDLMTMEGTLRPSRLQMEGNEIIVELPGQSDVSDAATGETTEEAAPVPARAAMAANGSGNGTAPSLNGASSGQRFEMSVDSFFGARHFIDPGSGAPHHHSYRVEATFATSRPDRHGFVVGFANVREMVDSTVMSYSETLLNTEDPFREIPPTTENLAMIFHQKISAKLQELDVPSVGLDRIRVWESPTNSASYSNHGSGSGPGARSSGTSGEATETDPDAAVAS